MARLRYLDTSDAAFIAQELTARLFPGSPAFSLLGDAGRDRLEGALDAPRWPVHRQLQDKAAVLLWHLIEDHPYVDGNKRFAVAATETFLWLNQAALIATDDELKELAEQIAKGNVERPECRSFVAARCIRRRWSARLTSLWVKRLRPADLEAVASYLDDHTPLDRGRRISAAIRAVVDS